MNLDAESAKHFLEQVEPLVDFYDLVEVLGRIIEERLSLEPYNILKSNVIFDSDLMNQVVKIEGTLTNIPILVDCKSHIVDTTIHPGVVTSESMCVNMVEKLVSCGIDKTHAAQTIAEIVQLHREANKIAKEPIPFFEIIGDLPPVRESLSSKNGRRIFTFATTIPVFLNDIIKRNIFYQLLVNYLLDAIHERVTLSSSRGIEYYYFVTKKNCLIFFISPL